VPDGACGLVQKKTLVEKQFVVSADNLFLVSVIATDMICEIKKQASLVPAGTDRHKKLKLSC
jgi:hypothetical protein